MNRKITNCITSPNADGVTHGHTSSGHNRVVVWEEAVENNRNFDIHRSVHFSTGFGAVGA
jgi:hypothetical protein